MPQETFRFFESLVRGLYQRLFLATDLRLTLNHHCRSDLISKRE